MSIVQLVYVFLVAKRKSYEDDGIGGVDATATVGIFEADQNIERTHPLMLISFSSIYTYTFTHTYKNIIIQTRHT